MPLIQQETDRPGGLSFARFMELALYAPELGYYERSSNAIGRRGDFFTSVSVGPLFGELLACQFAGWLRQRQAPRPVLVEAGGHDGRLAADILQAGQLHDADLFHTLEYWLIEPSPTRKSWQQATLSRFAGQVRWFQSWTELSSFCDSAGQPGTTIVFGNELLDAFPVHRLRWNRGAGSWEEMGVCRSGDALVWRNMPLSEAACAYANEVRQSGSAAQEELLWPVLPPALLDALPDGFTTEICPGALHWWREAAAHVNAGWLVTIDYGLEGPEFFTPQRASGTIRAYHNHRLVDDLLAQPGQQDLTSHVNFSALRCTGEQAGLTTSFSRDQGTFLTRIAADVWRQGARVPTPEQLRQFHTLTHPGQMGKAFRVLVQNRGVNSGG